jgi:hypothetical protein
MCCLRYEFEAYKDFKLRAPKVGAIIDTPVGQAKVVSFDTPRELVNLRLTNPENSKMFTIPFSQIAIDSEKDKNDKSGACCGCSVSLDTLHECCARSLLQELSSLESASEGFSDAERARGESRKPRRRSTGAHETKPAAEGTNGTSQKNAAAPNNNRKHRRSKGPGSGSGTSGGETSNRLDGKNAQQKQPGDAASANRGEASSHKRSPVTNGAHERSGAAVKSQERTKPRPGQKSSGLRKNSAGVSSADTATRVDSGYGNRRRRTSVDASKRKGSDGTAS